jgi:hypothetical protein
MSTINTPRILYWTVAQLQPNRTGMAMNLLAQEGFTLYAPKIREQRVIRGHRRKVISALFPGYAFVRIALQWHAACWCPGVVRLVWTVWGTDPVRPVQGAFSDLRRHGRARAGRGPAQFFGGQQRVTLAEHNVEVIPS